MFFTHIVYFCINFDAVNIPDAVTSTVAAAQENLSILLNQENFIKIFNQENIFNLFGITDLTKLSMFTNSGDVDSLRPLDAGDTALSYETLKVLYESLLEHWKEGLSLQDMDEIAYVITFFRFLFVSLKYNMKTAFYICCISHFSGVLWIYYLEETAGTYISLIGANGQGLLVKLCSSEQAIADFNGKATSAVRDIGKIDPVYFDEIRSRVHLLKEYLETGNPILFVKTIIVKGISETTAGGKTYYIDPISMLVARIPLENIYRDDIIKIYYIFYLKIFPTMYVMLGSLWNLVKSFVFYTAWVRFKKKYCPYHIRWHWTFVMTYHVLMVLYAGFITRIYEYTVFLQHKIDIGKLKSYYELDTLRTVIYALIFFHYLTVWYAFIHAIFGQYFFVPFLTRNVELHVGQRKSKSIYSGGYTSWQDDAEFAWWNSTDTKKDNKIKLWWGWLGRSGENSFNPRQWRKMEIARLRKRRISPSKRFKKFLRKVRQYFVG